MKRMKTLALVLVVALLFSMFVLPFSASAAPQTADDVATATSCEAKILYAMVDTANAAILLAVRLARLTPYDDVPALLIAVEAIASAVFLYAESIGAEVECEYTEYEIDGQTVLIDPLRVINIPLGGGNNGNGGNNNTLN